MVKKGKIKLRSTVVGAMGAELKVWHEKPMPKVYRELDSDLARDNIENDIPFADLQDIR